MPIDQTNGVRKLYIPPALRKLNLEEAEQLLGDATQSRELLEHDLKERILFRGAE